MELYSKRSTLQVVQTLYIPKKDRPLPPQRQPLSPWNTLFDKSVFDHLVSVSA